MYFIINKITKVKLGTEVYFIMALAFIYLFQCFFWLSVGFIYIISFKIEFVYNAKN